MATSDDLFRWQEERRPRKVVVGEADQWMAYYRSRVEAAVRANLGSIGQTTDAIMKIIYEFRGAAE